MENSAVKTHFRVPPAPLVDVRQHKRVSRADRRREKSGKPRVKLWRSREKEAEARVHSQHRGCVRRAHLQRFHHFPERCCSAPLGSALLEMCKKLEKKHSPADIFPTPSHFLPRRFNTSECAGKVRCGAVRANDSLPRGALDFQQTRCVHSLRRLPPVARSSLPPFTTLRSPTQPFSSSARRRDGECVGTNMKRPESDEAGRKRPNAHRGVTEWPRPRDGNLNLTILSWKAAAFFPPNLYFKLSFIARTPVHMKKGKALNCILNSRFMPCQVTYGLFHEQC